MSDSSPHQVSNPENVAPDPQSTESNRSGKEFNAVRVLVTVLVVAVVGGGVAGAWFYFDNQPPALYPVKGVAYLDGEPMPDGLVMTKYVSEGGKTLLGGLTVINKNGEFEMKTNGEPGLYKGEHKVYVVWTNNGFPPISYIPKKYSDPEQTPFSVTVDKNTQETPLKLELFGKKDVPERSAGIARPPGPPGQQPGPPNRPEANSEQNHSEADDHENESTN